jgi:lysophospholipase L1-like esterase
VCTGTPTRAVTVYMIGDSTMSVYAADRYPRMGWGQPLGDLFSASCAKVVDKALSGRSSKSFFDEGAWTPIKNALVAGDYVLIQFGHNDEKSEEPSLYTEPQTTYKEFLTTYITDTRAKGATPLLLTSIHRNGWTGTTIKDSHGAYPPAVRELAAALDVELIDLHALTKTYFERVGQAATTVLFMNLNAGEFPNYPNGNSDNTHLRESGARAIGRLAMTNAYSQRLTLATLLKAVPTDP